jgi:chemotaxis protein methyltransferase CheR
VIRPPHGVASDSGDMSELLEFVTQHTGLIFPPNRRATAEGGVQRAMRHVGIRNVASLLARVREDLETLDELLAELTVGETYFFREEGQFDFMRRVAVPQLLAGRSEDSVLRAWSAACASGEEAYSLAITLRETAPHVPRHIIGTDVSRHRLRTAQRGNYKNWSLRGVSPERVTRYFTKQGAVHRLIDVERQGVEFRYLNLVEDVFPSIASSIWGMDIIMCRNVLIYFDIPTIQVIAAHLLESLSDDGWLFLGASDPAISDFLPCDVELTGAGVAYRRPHGKTPALPRFEKFAPVIQTEEAVFEWALPPAPSLPQEPALTSLEAPPLPVPVSEDGLDIVRRAYAAREYARAADSARELISTGNAALEVWICLVRALANEGRLMEAGTACSSALEQYGTSAELMYLHAVLLAEGGRHRDSADAARRALYLDRDLIVAQLLLGSALAKLGDRSAAVRVLTTAERTLAAADPESLVPSSDGEPAGRLREMARVQLKLVEMGAA